MKKLLMTTALLSLFAFASGCGHMYGHKGGHCSGAEKSCSKDGKESCDKSGKCGTDSKDEKKCADCDKK